MQGIIKKLLALFILLPGISMAQQEEPKLDFSGFIDAYYAVRSTSPYDFMSTRNRFRGELKMQKNRSYFFTSFNVLHNSAIPEQTGLELREAYFEYAAPNWDIRAGRQIIAWGVADALQIVDIISPLDFTEFLARDYDDIRIPANALRFSYHTPKMRLEVIYVPIPSFTIVPFGPTNAWSFFPTSGEPYFSVNLNERPEMLLENSEYGGRLSFYLSGVDLNFSALHTWNKTPVFTSSYSMAFDTVYVQSHYGQMDIVSTDFSIPVGAFVFRGEAAYNFNEIQALAQEQNGKVIITKNSLNALLGIDWYPGGEWNITAQYSIKTINNYSDNLAVDEISSLATLGISKSVLRSTLKFSTFAYIDIDNEGLFDRTSAEYALSDAISLFIGCDWFQGDKGVFSTYKDNSEYWLKAKLSF